MGKAIRIIWFVVIFPFLNTGEDFAWATLLRTEKNLGLLGKWLRSFQGNMNLYDIQLLNKSQYGL